MAVNYTDLLRRTAPGGTPTGAVATARAGNGEAFRELLDSRAAYGAADTGSPPDAATQAELVRLRMMRAAVSLQSDDGEAPTPTTFSTTENLLRRLAAYGEHQPSRPDRTFEAEAGAEPAESVSTPVSSSSCPQPLHDIISRASRRYGVDQGLIRAVIRAESNFNPNAVSSAGARGLMQLMPGTARGLGVTDSFDPEQNVMAGTRYLRQMLDRYNGDLDSALAAYNWGPGNVDRRGGFLPRETRSYLSTVKGYYSDFTG